MISQAAQQAALIKMHTPEIASAFKPPAAIWPFLLRTCAVKKGGNETNIRKEPATCKNYLQVHWLCVLRLALLGNLCLAVPNIHNAFVFTHRTKDREPLCHRVRANFGPGFIVAYRAVYPTISYHAFTLSLIPITIIPYLYKISVPTFVICHCNTVEPHLWPLQPVPGSIWQSATVLAGYAGRFPCKMHCTPCFAAVADMIYGQGQAAFQI